jgi:hypothetical protein
MPYTGAVTAEQAAQAARARLAIGRKRQVPPMLGLIEQMKYSRKFRIFNVGPWAHTVNSGSTGSFFIPMNPTEKQCADAGKPYKTCVEMTPSVDAIVDELVIKSEAEYSRLIDDGRQFCEELLGLGRGCNRAFALTHAGCFLAEGDEPTERELHKANLELRANCSEIVAEIRSVYATDRKQFSLQVRPQIHYRAAEVLHLVNETWMLDSSPTNQIRCKGCGAMCEADVATCPNGHILNQRLYNDFIADQAMQAEAEAGPTPNRKSK